MKILGNLIDFTKIFVGLFLVVVTLLAVFALISINYGNMPVEAASVQDWGYLLEGIMYQTIGVVVIILYGCISFGSWLSGTSCVVFPFFTGSVLFVATVLVSLGLVLVSTLRPKMKNSISRLLKFANIFVLIVVGTIVTLYFMGTLIVSLT